MEQPKQKEKKELSACEQTALFCLKTEVAMKIFSSLHEIFFHIEMAIGLCYPQIMEEV